jgi:hypothetical protein
LFLVKAQPTAPEVSFAMHSEGLTWIPAAGNGQHRWRAIAGLVLAAACLGTGIIIGRFTVPMHNAVSTAQRPPLGQLQISTRVLQRTGQQSRWLEQDVTSPAAPSFPQAAGQQNEKNAPVIPILLNPGAASLPSGEHKAEASKSWKQVLARRARTNPHTAARPLTAVSPDYRALRSYALRK